MMASNKPQKKKDHELWKLIDEKISDGNYLFLSHAKQRLKERSVSDFEVLDILENKLHRKRKRIKSKDVYKSGYADWCYCIEGNNLDKKKIRIIISFNDNLMLIITVIRIDDGRNHYE